MKPVFIKLSEDSYIQVDWIGEIIINHKGQTVLICKDCNKTYTVPETPEQILKLIDKAYDPPLRSE